MGKSIRIDLLVINTNIPLTGNKTRRTRKFFSRTNIPMAIFQFKTTFFQEQLLKIEFSIETLILQF